MCTNHAPPPSEDISITKRRRDPFSFLLYAMVYVYRITLGPFLGGQCRYQPTCSEYMILAVNKYGPLKGGWKGFCRIMRCHPFVKGGIDYP